MKRTNFGEYGKLNKENGKAQCHICGRWFLNLGLHVTRGIHGMTCSEYREIFGLSRRYPLAGELFSNRQRENHSDRISRYKSLGQSKILAQSIEDRKALRAIPRRESTRIANREARVRENSVQRLQTPEINKKRRMAMRRPEYRQKVIDAWFRQPPEVRESRIKKMRNARGANA